MDKIMIIVNDEVITKIAPWNFRASRMVPAVQFCTADQIIQRAVIKSNIAVLKEPIDGIEHQVQRQYLFVYTHQYKRETGQGQL